MTYQLDAIDTAIINSLMEDGRKSFRQISREINISTPTVKARFQRLLNMRLVTSVSPVIDTSKLKTTDGLKLESSKKLKTGSTIKLNCDYCGGPINDKPKILRFANMERFLCCNGCKTHYKEKYKGRIESLIEQYNESKRH